MQGVHATETRDTYGISWSFSGLVEISKDVATMKLEIPIDPSWEEDLSLWRKGEAWSARRPKDEDEAEMQGCLSAVALIFHHR